jgi:alanyl-tRNA synthetase
VTTRILPLDEARAQGAMALFGEKYGEEVRMVDIGGPWSRELCAGIHVSNSSQIGLINLVGESSIGSTNRRVESLVGLDAFRDFATERALINQLTSSLKTPREQLPDRIADLSASLKAAEKRIAEFEAAALATRVPALAEKAAPVGSLTVVAESVGSVKSTDELRSLATSVRERLGSASSTVVALAADVAGKPSVIVVTTAGAREAGVKAGVLARTAASILGGGGGGKDDLAQGGGSDLAAIPAALTAIVDGVRAA